MGKSVLWLTLLLLCWMFLLAESTDSVLQAQSTPVTERTEQLQVPTPIIRQTHGLSCLRPTLAHGTVTLIPRGTDRIYPGDVAKLVCDRDYELKTKDFLYSYSYIRCSDSGQWTTPHGFKLLPTCKAKVCDLPEMIPFGTYDILGPLLQLAPYGQPTGPPVYGSRARYQCNDGYVLEDPAAQIRHCVDGQWEGEKPVCRAQLSCPRAPDVDNSECTFYTTSVLCDSNAVENDKKIYYRCLEDFTLKGSAVLTCNKGEWDRPAPSCQPDQPLCNSPPRLLHGDRNIYPANMVAGRFPHGSQAAYYCLNGYSFDGDNKPSVEIICRNGKWVGSIPRCLKRLHCDVPQNIPNGNWVIVGAESKYSVGMTISYECNPGFTPYGKTKLECLSSGYWSDNPPKCFAKGMYCPDPGKVDNGFYVCQPRHCSLLSVGMIISYVCDSGYEPLGDIRQTCMQGSQWSGSKPVCMPIITTPKVDSTLGINSGTVTVVIATTCCVLGLLLVVMIVVALQRRKPAPRLCHPVQPPPPAYPRPRSDSMDEHDRVALIASADGVHVVLPSYEEATRGARGSSSATRFNGDTTTSIRRGDYRPLPTIPASMRTATRLDSPRSGHPVVADHHRNSIITNSSLARDNISLVFGSMDTMNISDGTSTSVTIETFDSTSNPSIALSQRAATGSLGSSNGSLANEDAPLLDNISESGRIPLPPRSTDPVVSDEQKQD